MKLIIWLWNPWEKYKNTRHNVWFLFLDFLQEKLNISWKFEEISKFKAEILETNINGEKTLLVKPLTFMNLSWESVLKLLSFYKIEKKDIIVIFDDISLEPGKIRFRASGSAGWQNGVKSIIWNIWEDFKRIKIGIGQDKRWDLSDWVLSKFSDTELEKLKSETCPEVYDLLLKNL